MSGKSQTEHVCFLAIFRESSLLLDRSSSWLKPGIHGGHLQPLWQQLQLSDALTALGWPTPQGVGRRNLTCSEWSRVTTTFSEVQREVHAFAFPVLARHIDTAVVSPRRGPAKARTGSAVSLASQTPMGPKTKGPSALGMHFRSCGC